MQANKRLQRQRLSRLRAISANAPWNALESCSLFTSVKMNKPMNFSWFVEGKLAGMAYPLDEDIPFLIASGLGTVINLTPYPAYYTETANAKGITVHNISIEDFTSPTYEQILEFLDIVDSAETPVCVHCGKGMGRTGTMLACYLVAKEGYNTEDAITETRKRRRYSIETYTQENAIHEFERTLKNRNRPRRT